MGARPEQLCDPRAPSLGVPTWLKVMPITPNRLANPCTVLRHTCIAVAISIIINQQNKAHSN